MVLIITIFSITLYISKLINYSKDIYFNFLTIFQDIFYDKHDYTIVILPSIFVSYHHYILHIYSQIDYPLFRKFTYFICQNFI